MISFGKTQWIAELKSLWQDTFGDSDAYLAAFFAEQYRDENTLVYLEDGQPVSALYIIPYALQQGTEHYPMAYFYALATRPEYRGRGYMTRMLTQALALCRARDMALACLIPANEALFAYYEKFGFKAGFEMRTLSLTRMECYHESGDRTAWPLLNLHPATAAEFWQAYCLSPYYGPDAVQLSQAQNDFYMKTVLDEGGQLLRFDLPGAALPERLPFQEGRVEAGAYTIIQRRENELLIIESNVDETHWPILAHSLFLRFQEASQITLQEPLFHTAREQCRPFAMVRKFKALDLSRTVANRFLQ